MSKPRIVVTGSNGQLGNEVLAHAMQYPQFEFIFLTREHLPIDDRAAIIAFFDVHRPQYCINCAAYTAVDKAESEKETAFLVNGDGAGYLAEACKMAHTRMVHISTDYVFNGTAEKPYREDDDIDPVNTYGASKLKGEIRVKEINPDSLIIRTSWVYSHFGNNFVKTIMRLMKTREKISVVNDQFGSPTYAADLAVLILNIIRSGEWKPGIYHYSNEGMITWYNFAEAIREITGSSCEIIPIPTEAYPTPAKRPSYSVFDTSKIKAVYQVNIPQWKDSLKKCMGLMAVA